MGSYSMDLRERVAAAIDEGECSKRQIAKRFRVTVSFCTRLLQRRRDAGTLAPKPYGGGPRPVLGFPEQVRLAMLIAEHPDATLNQLKEWGGFACTLTTIWRTLRRSSGDTIPNSSELGMVPPELPRREVVPAVRCQSASHRTPRTQARDDRAGRQRPHGLTDALFRSGQRPLISVPCGAVRGADNWANSCPRCSERSGNSCDCNSTIDCVASAEQVLASLARAARATCPAIAPQQPLGCATACNPSGVCDTWRAAYCGLSTTIAPGSGVESSRPRHAPKSVTRPLLRPPCLVPSPPTKRLTSETKNPGCGKPKMSRQGQLRISLLHASLPAGLDSQRLSGIHTNAHYAAALKQRIRDLIGAKQWASCQKTVVFSVPMFVYRIASHSASVTEPPASADRKAQPPRRMSQESSWRGRLLGLHPV